MVRLGIPVRPFGFGFLIRRWFQCSLSSVSQARPSRGDKMPLLPDCSSPRSEEGEKRKSMDEGRLNTKRKDGKTKREYNYWRIVVVYSDGESSGHRIFKVKKRAEEWAERQRKSRVVKSVRLEPLVGRKQGPRPRS